MAYLEKELSDREYQMLESKMREHDKSHGVAYLLWFFLGYFGVHKFYIGNYLMGFLYPALGFMSIVFFLIGISAPEFFGFATLMGMGLGVLLLYDLFTMPRQIRDVKSKKKNKFIRQLLSENIHSREEIHVPKKQNIQQNFSNVSSKQRFKTYIAGAHHYKQKNQPLVNEKLKIKRDLDNRHDENAVKVLTLLGEKVGYIPADRAEMLSESIDSGRQFYAMVDKIEDSNADKSKNHYVISVHEIPKVNQSPD